MKLQLPATVLNDIVTKAIAASNNGAIGAWVPVYNAIYAALTTTATGT